MINHIRGLATAVSAGNQVQPLMHDGMAHIMNGQNGAFAVPVEIVAVLWEYCIPLRQSGEDHGKGPEKKPVENDEQALGSSHTNAARCR
jgi:hypothetical protein